MDMDLSFEKMSIAPVESISEYSKEHRQHMAMAMAAAAHIVKEATDESISKNSKQEVTALASKALIFMLETGRQRSMAETHTTEVLPHKPFRIEILLDTEAGSEIDIAATAALSGISRSLKSGDSYTEYSVGPDGENEDAITFFPMVAHIDRLPVEAEAVRIETIATGAVHYTIQESLNI